MWKQSVEVIGYVDGSYSGGYVGGAGVYFGEANEFNRCVPVPKSGRAGSVYDSLRAELYASLLFLYICYDEKRVPLHTRLLIRQDSIVAIHLLQMCIYGSCAELERMCPSDWARGSQCHFRREYVWGEIIDAKTILQYADILNRWWLMTKGRPYAPLKFEWVQAHRTEPDTFGSPEHDKWKGNNLADIFAKIGARSNKQTDVDCYSNYPLFRADRSMTLPPKTDPKKDYLPLSDHPSPLVIVPASNY